MMRQEDIVGIQRRDEASARRVDGGIARRAAALVFLMQQPDARIAEAGDCRRRDHPASRHRQ